MLYMTKEQSDSLPKKLQKLGDDGMLEMARKYAKIGYTTDDSEEKTLTEAEYEIVVSIMQAALYGCQFPDILFTDISQIAVMAESMARFDSRLTETDHHFYDRVYNNVIVMILRILDTKEA